MIKASRLSASCLQVSIWIPVEANARSPLRYAIPIGYRVRLVLYRDKPTGFRVVLGIMDNRMQATIIGFHRLRVYRV